MSDRRYRVTIERADGVFYTSDERVAPHRLDSLHAQQSALAAFRAKHPEFPVDGRSHWVRRCVRIEEAT